MGTGRQVGSLRVGHGIASPRALAPTDTGIMSRTMTTTATHWHSTHRVCIAPTFLQVSPVVYGPHLTTPGVHGTPVVGIRVHRLHPWTMQTRRGVARWCLVKGALPTVPCLRRHLDRTCLHQHQLLGREWVSDVRASLRLVVTRVARHPMPVHALVEGQVLV